MNQISGYSIADEPRPGALSHIAVDPVWPLFAVMFAGIWLSWPWFVVNGFLVGCPARKRTLAVVAGGLIGIVALFFGVVGLVEQGWLPRASIPYLRLILVAWKLGITYFLYIQQAGTLELYQYYGGPVRNGILAVIAGYFAWSKVATSVLEVSPLLYVLMD